MVTSLIVNADDFGISPGVNQGILEAHLTGIVTSTTVMINLPDAEGAIRMAQHDAPRLGLGLHFNLSFGAPVTAPEQVPSLIKANGRFCSSWPELIEMAPHFSPGDVRAELTAQFERFVQVAGRLPDHFDSHHDITYGHPAALDCMLKLAARHHIPLRNGEAMFGPESLAPVPRESPAAKESLFKELRAVYAANAKPRWPQAFLPQTTFFDEGSTLDNMLDILAHLPDGFVEIICHPGYARELQEAYNAPRERELRIVTDPRVREAIANYNIRLITFAELPE